MKNNKKSKLVLFSVLGLAAISIGTVGFATWITGVVETKASDTVIVNVDTSKNKTAIIEATLNDKSLTLKEPTSTEAEKSNQIITVESGAETDLKITFSKFRVIVSSAYKLQSVSFDIGTTSIDNCKISEDKLSIYPTKLYEGIDNTNSLSYLKVGTATIELSSLKKIESGEGYVEGYSCYTLNSMEYSFSWGTMFGDGTQKPSTYLSKCTEATNSLSNIEDKLAYIEKCNKMLNAMYTNLDGNSLTLSVIANVIEVGAGA